jgi:hypothetical protein
LATYLTTELAGEGITVTYNDSILGFNFTGGGGLDIVAGSTANTLLGFAADTVYANQTQSVQPINLLGPGSILVHTNFSLHTLPISGVLAMVPITGNYGSLITYRDVDGAQPILVTQSDIADLHIKLTDENNNLLEGYADIPWRMVISLEILHAPGFVNPGEQHGVGLVPRTIPQTQQFYKQLGSFS